MYFENKLFVMQINPNVCCSKEDTQNWVPFADEDRSCVFELRLFKVMVKNKLD